MGKKLDQPMTYNRTKPGHNGERNHDESRKTVKNLVFIWFQELQIRTKSGLNGTKPCLIQGLRSKSGLNDN